VAELASWRHCPRCAGDLAVTGDGSKAECPNCGFTHYAHSAVTACAITVDGAGRILLARRARPPFEGRWDLPGGFLGEGEHPRDAVKRELHEETGLEVEPGEFVGIWMDHYSEDDSGPSTMNLYFEATAPGGEGEPADDVAELRWCAADQLPPPEEFAFHIADVLRAWRDQHA